MTALARSVAACALVTVCTFLTACSQTTVMRTRYSLASEPAMGEPRTVIRDDRGARRPAHLSELGSTLRMDHDGVTLPVVSPDGKSAAVQTACDAPWNVRLGDALPPEGVHTRIEAVSLESSDLGQPLATLTGNWLLGRAASNEAFLVERPRADGARDIALAEWKGGAVRDVANDGWTNAFATVTSGGSLAWCRRPAEGGDWRLVVERRGQRRVLEGNPGEQWLFPIFAGDGTGIFALRNRDGGLALAWIPFELDGLPSAEATRAPVSVIPIALGADLRTAAQVVDAEGGLAGSCPGSDRVVVFVPASQRTATWTPGGRLELLTERSVAATMLDSEAVLVTTGEMLGTQRLGDPEGRVDMLADGPWVARPTTASSTLVVIMRTLGGRVELAQLDVQRPEAKR